MRNNRVMHRIKDLNAKIEFVESVSEFRAVRARIEMKHKRRMKPEEIHAHLRVALQEQVYADVVGVVGPQWSRIKSGKGPIKDHQLSALASYLDLDEFGGAAVWTLPIEEFKSVLKRKGYGKLASVGGFADLPARLRAMAGPTPSIRIVTVTEAAARGIGDTDAPDTMPILALGARVRVELNGFPFDGFAVVVSEDPSRRLVALGRPGSLATPVQAGETLVLPGSNGTYPVGKPLGRHSLYAVLFPQRLDLPHALEGETPSGTLSLGQEAALTDALTGAGGGACVALLDYRVE